MGQMRDTKDKNEYGTKKKEEKQMAQKGDSKEGGNDTDRQEKN
jgi:hypothetical protein